MVDENYAIFSGFRLSEISLPNYNDLQHSLLDEVDEYKAQELDYSSDERNSEDETSQTQYGRLTKKLRVENLPSHTLALASLQESIKALQCTNQSSSLMGKENGPV